MSFILNQQGELETRQNNFNFWLEELDVKILYLTKGRFGSSDYDRDRLYSLFADYHSTWNAARIVVNERDPIY